MKPSRTNPASLYANTITNDRHLRIKWPFSEYRQCCKAIVRNCIIPVSKNPFLGYYFGVVGEEESGGSGELREDAQQPYAQQSGHSSETGGSAYGYTNIDVGKLDPENYERQMHASGQWHIWTGLYGPATIDVSSGTPVIRRGAMPALGREVSSACWVIFKMLR